MARKRLTQKQIARRATVNALVGMKGGAVGGAWGGAIAGAGVGAATGNPKKGAKVGATIGAPVGATYGLYTGIRHSIGDDPKSRKVAPKRKTGYTTYTRRINGKQIQVKRKATSKRRKV